MEFRLKLLFELAIRNSPLPVVLGRPNFDSNLRAKEIPFSSPLWFLRLSHSDSNFEVRGTSFSCKSITFLVGAVGLEPTLYGF